MSFKEILGFILTFCTFIFGVCIVLGPIVLSQYKKDNLTTFDRIDNFFLFFKTKDMFTLRGQKLQVVLRRTFVTSVVFGLTAFILLATFYSQS